MAACSLSKYLKTLSISYVLSNEKCVVNPTFCKTIDTFVKSGVSLVLFFVGISIH